MRLNNMLLNNEWVNNEIKEEIKSYQETDENEHTTTKKSKGYSESSPEREIHSITGLSQETNKNKQCNYNLKKTRKEKQTKPKVSRRKELIKIRAKINLALKK